MLPPHTVFLVLFNHTQGPQPSVYEQKDPLVTLTPNSEVLRRSTHIRRHSQAHTPTHTHSVARTPNYMHTHTRTHTQTQAYSKGETPICTGTSLCSEHSPSVLSEGVGGGRGGRGGGVGGGGAAVGEEVEEEGEKRRKWRRRS